MGSASKGGMNMAKRVGSQSDQPFIKLYRELTYR